MGIAVGKAAQKAVYTMDVMAGIYIRITARERNDATKAGATVYICRDYAKLLGVGLLRIADGKEKL